MTCSHVHNFKLLVHHLINPRERDVDIRATNPSPAIETGIKINDLRKVYHNRNFSKEVVQKRQLLLCVHTFTCTCMCICENMSVHMCVGECVCMNV